MYFVGSGVRLCVTFVFVYVLVCVRVFLFGVLVTLGARSA